MTVGNQEEVDTFGETQTKTTTLSTVSTSTVKYDLVGEIARRTTLTRRTVCTILKGLKPSKLAMFRNNPEEFIKNVSKLIKDEKATMIVEHIEYDRLNETYDSSIFTQEKHAQPISKAYNAQKSIMDYVFTDGSADKSVERTFAESLDIATEVCVYAKLPRAFQIPTPVGNYSPDWAIAFNDGSVKHVFFVAETKGSMDSMELRAIENAKTACAKKLFQNISDAHVCYGVVSDYQELMDLVKG